MNFAKLVDSLSRTDLNLYDLAVYADGGISMHSFQPCNNCNDFYSVAKAFVVTAIGLLWQDGLVKVEDRIADILPIPAGASPDWKLATVEHALLHRLGLPEGFLDIDVEDASEYETDDYLTKLFLKPLVCRPGEEYHYSDAGYYLLSRVVSQLSGETLDTFLQRRVLNDLHLREIAWSRCPQGHPLGATGLYLSAQDAVKLGAVYLQKGQWKGKQLLSEEWVRLVVERGYEFHSLQTIGAYGKGGMYGQMLLFSPEGQFALALHAFDSSGVGKALVKALES